MADGPARRLGAYALGFLTQSRVRRILELADWHLEAGPLARDLDAVAVWGDRPVARRGRAAARRRGLPVLCVEDAFFRSVTPREAPLGLTLDTTGFLADASRPSDLENLLNLDAPLTGAEEARALELIARLRRERLSKYNDDWRDADALPDRDFVLVVDQVPGDAAIRLGQADAGTFDAMLGAALAEHPDREVAIRGHPRATGGGHLDATHERVTILAPGYNPHDLLARARAVYCVTSQLGFEAMLHGHRPHVFGAPFYAGWGLSEDRAATPRRQSTPTLAQLVHRVLIDYPLWYDPYTDALCEVEQVLDALCALRRAHRLRRRHRVAVGMRRWKRRRMARFLGPLSHVDDARDAIAPGLPVVAWGDAGGRELEEKCADAGCALARVEDGFVRSRGLGAALVPAGSLAVDGSGIYFDTTRPSDLEHLIRASPGLAPDQIRRARALREAIAVAGVSKYNQGSGDANEARDAVLVVGQVEDDASIRLGTDAVSTNLALIEAVRRDIPDARIAYKPHPDVEAGLRDDATGAAACDMADVVLKGTAPHAAIRAARKVATMTSLLGFEALICGTPVRCYGRPFFGGLGLTEDLPEWDRGMTGVTLDGLVHAALIDYPIYLDPVTRAPCPPEVLVARLAGGAGGTRGPVLSLLARIQNALAGQARWWR